LGDTQTGAADVICQECGKSWPEDQSICPEDGTWLHEQTIMEIKPRAKRASLAEFPGHESTVAQKTEATPQPQKLEKAVVRTGDGPLAKASANALHTELAPGTQIGEYEVEMKIGEGAMGTVYRAIHPAIHKRVAIKIMTPKLFDEPESVKRFVTEARAIAAIEHPGIVDVFGFGRIPDGRTYLVMEWLEGQSLGARLQKGPLPWTEACGIIRSIARALEAAHAKNIVHRDLKPENVYLQQIDDDKPLVKLLDFGLAKTTSKEDGLVAKTRTGQMLGTPLYMSPEQCKSKGVDHRTDIYALGCMAYEMLLGKTPFDADNVAELISAHLVTEPPRPSTLKPDIDPNLDKLLFSMVAKDPDKRPGLGEVRRLIGMELSHASIPIMTPPDGYPVLGRPSGELAAPKPTAPQPEPERVAEPAAQPRWPLFVAIALAVLGAVALFAVLQ
jgi:eukaryotic-like serine/threonine-protein kinase